MGTELDAVAGPVERGVGRLEPERADFAPPCGYCKAQAPGWTTTEAAAARRWRNGALQYHCYGAYCWD